MLGLGEGHTAKTITLFALLPHQEFILLGIANAFRARLGLGNCQIRGAEAIFERGLDGSVRTPCEGSGEIGTRLNRVLAS